MNTDFKSLFETKENYLAFRKKWSLAANNPEYTKNEKVCHQYLDGSMHLLYSILRNKEITHGYTRATSRIKPGNGYKPYLAIEIHARNLRSNLYSFIKYPNNSSIGLIFGDTLSVEIAKAVYEYIDMKTLDIIRLT